MSSACRFLSSARAHKCETSEATLTRGMRRIWGEGISEFWYRVVVRLRLRQLKPLHFLSRARPRVEIVTFQLYDRRNSHARLWDNSLVTRKLTCRSGHHIKRKSRFEIFSLKYQGCFSAI